ncbi:hypothetical protein Pan241w_53750 [Gimesia alba]|uniref:Uncharacterized protein n=1 Tax=Gimesia alba TaxID=2527973 RepID=A0A517RMZ7_9PLAN|nr:hypothetical protein Pan241w_53750 [Gimesia alba]
MLEYVLFFIYYHEKVTYHERVGASHRFLNQVTELTNGG